MGGNRERTQHRKTVGRKGGPCSDASLQLKSSIVRASLQIRVLRLGFLQDGDVGVGVFPKTEVGRRAAYF